MRAIIVDINGTISDVSKVVHFIQGPDKDWESFFGNMNDVPVNPMVRDFIKRFKIGYAIVLVSGAPERYRVQTESWLRQHGVPFDRIFFRPEHDKRRGWQFKKSLYEKKLKQVYQVKLVLDDKADACRTWTEMGLPCWKLPSDMDQANARSEEPGKRFQHLIRTPQRSRL